MNKGLMFPFSVDFYYWDYILTLYRLAFLIEQKTDYHETQISVE